MLNCFKLICNIGVFDSVPATQPVALDKLTLIYAENGRGKTTLAAMLRSLATGNAQSIQERARLGATHPPHIVIERLGITQALVYQNGSWSQTHDSIVIYDDTFVDDNVYSGLDVDADHRQNLHQLIVGAQGVALANRVDHLADTISSLNREIRERASAIPASARGTMSADAFCALAARQDIDNAIRSAERTLSAVNEAEAVRTTSFFSSIALPIVDFPAIEALLLRDLPSLNAKAAEQVRKHLASLGEGGEAWVAEGVAFANRIKEANVDTACPFCEQSLARSSLIEHYEVYFSQAYSELKQAISSKLEELDTLLGGDAPAAFERTAGTVERARLFWSKLCDVPAVAMDAPAVATAWTEARDALRALLLAKQSSPLEKVAFDEGATKKIEAYRFASGIVADTNAALQAAATTIAAVKQRAASGNAATGTAEVAKLKAIKARCSTSISPLCQAYLDVVAKKDAAEARKQTARQALDQYRATVFPTYEASINRYLTRFNAGFSLAEVKPANPVGRPSTNYAIKINNVVVPLNSSGPGRPCFKTTLSAGDRNALALAFFFASLERDSQLTSRVIVIDDPVSSLDDGRTVTTVQEIRHLVDKVKQVIVLSHSKRFLCSIWERADTTCRKAIEVKRSQTGSDLVEWSVDQDCITEYDINHAVLRDYDESNAGSRRQVAQAIRPVLEGFLRVAFPAYLKPGMVLGPFENLVGQRIGQVGEILNQDDYRELTDIRTYANKFHHDTNPAWQTEAINDTELVGFVRRTLGFARR